jgi:hypothetical protein
LCPTLLRTRSWWHHSKESSPLALPTYSVCVCVVHALATATWSRFRIRTSMQSCSNVREGTPVVVVGCKLQALLVIVKLDAPTALCRNHSCPRMLTSSATGENAQEVFIICVADTTGTHHQPRTPGEEETLTCGSSTCRHREKI